MISFSSVQTLPFCSHVVLILSKTFDQFSIYKMCIKRVISLHINPTRPLNIIMHTLGCHKSDTSTDELPSKHTLIKLRFDITSFLKGISLSFTIMTGIVAPWSSAPAFSSDNEVPRDTSLRCDNEWSGVASHETP